MTRHTAGEVHRFRGSEKGALLPELAGLVQRQNGRHGRPWPWLHHPARLAGQLLCGAKQLAELLARSLKTPADGEAG